MKLAEKILSSIKEKIDFAKIEKGLLTDLSKIDKKVAKEIDKKWGMEQVWGISGSIGGGIGGADKDHLKLFKEIVDMFGKDKEAQVKKAILKWDYSYDELEDGTQPW